MATPICLSQYFVNKQNVRSATNIVKPNFWKNEDQILIKQLVEHEHLVSELPLDLRNILLELLNNVRNKSKNDFKEYFPRDNNLTLHFVEKDVVFKNCWKALCGILPRKFSGCSNNTKILKNLIMNTIFSMKRQNFIIENILCKWDFTPPAWNTVPTTVSTTVIRNIILWLVRNVLAPMICLNFYVTTCKIDANENKLYYFWKNQWQSYYDRKISSMIFTKVIKKVDSYSLGRKIKRVHDPSSRLRLRSLRKDIPKLYLILKANNECRPIVRYKNDAQNSLLKYKDKDRLKFLKLLTGKPRTKIESQYNAIYVQWLCANKPKLYFIKTDLNNAFGSINKEKLMKILSERHMNFQKSEKCSYLKRKVAQQYKDLISELRKPSLIRAGSTIYEWKEGLVQGYKYSPALSELYYTHMDEIYLSKHINKFEDQIKLFTRVVDDYLYITDSLEDATSFLKALINYRNVNYGKTVVNFQHANIKSSNQIIFLGYSYNTLTLEVSRANNVFTGQMCYKIAFTSVITDLNKFLENRIGQSGIQINAHIFNMQHNSEELIWRHVFTTYCLSANKFCTILSVLCDEKEMTNYLLMYKKKVTVKLTNSILETLLKTKPCVGLFMYCINHFRYLSWKALYLCAKETKRCSGLVRLTKEELAKTNCLYGKWRNHSDRIDTNGENRRKAIREVCRRSDLRRIFRDFDKLPDGFECYNHRKLSV